MQNTYVVAVTQPVITLWTALVWLRLTLAAAFCRLLPTRLRCPNLVVLYCNCVGGYHSDLPSSWRTLERTVASVAPSIRWDLLDRFALLYDDQVTFPAECCRASLGYVLSVCDSTSEDPQAVASAWRSQWFVQSHGLHVAVFPAGDCLVADMPSLGPLSYLVCLVRALSCLRQETKASGLTAKVPGLLEVHSQIRRRVTFLLPLEGRHELLPF